MNRPLTSVELFTGAGGLALGVAAAGYSHRLLLEYNRDACESLRENQASFGGAGVELYEGDVKDFDFTQISDVDLLAAGAPCQPFSIGGKHRAHRDERNLFPQVFRATRDLRPKAVLVENVKGLMRQSLADFVEYIELQMAHPMILPKDPSAEDGWEEHLPRLRKVRDLRSDTSELQYVVRRVLLNAADFGVPQRRERVFFVAVRRDLGVAWRFPRPTHSQESLLLEQHVTGSYWTRHGLKRRCSPSHLSAGKWMRLAGRTESWITVRDALGGMPEPSPRKEAPGWLNHVGQPGARSYPGHTGSSLDAPAKTLKAGVHGVPGGENMLRRANGTVRYFTVREAARLQTFPDTYRFKGAWGEAMRQIGNAVPVSLAQAVARSVRECLQGTERNPTAAHAHLSRSEQLGAFVQEELPGFARSA